MKPRPHRVSTISDVTTLIDWRMPSKYVVTFWTDTYLVYLIRINSNIAEDTADPGIALIY